MTPNSDLDRRSQPAGIRYLAGSLASKISISDSPASSSASRCLEPLTRLWRHGAPDTPSSASQVISQPLASAMRSTVRRWTS
jgi:hypothetical protein